MGYDLALDPFSYIYTHARAFSSHPAFKLVGAVESVSDLRALFEKHYECPTYESLEKAIQELNPQIIVIAVPTINHSSIIQKVLHTACPLAILCEKPLSYTVDEARIIINSCADRTIKLYVNYIRRSDPGVMEIKRRFDKGEIVTPIKGVVWYSKGFIHNGSHFFNLLEYWLGEFQDAKIIDRGRSIDDFDVEPHVHVNFFKGGVNFIPAWDEHFSHFTIELISPSGRLYWGQARDLLWQTADSDTKFKTNRKLSTDFESIPSDMNRYQWNVAEQLALALANESGSLCSGSEAFTTLETMQKIIESDCQ